MVLHVDYHSGAPIYQQIRQQIQAQILDGTLAADAPLPSIRNLAKDLRISVITTKRAYEELERDGLVYTVPGKGCFVSGGDMEALRESRRREIAEHLRSAAALARSCGMGHADLQELLKEAMEDTQ